MLKIKEQEVYKYFGEERKKQMEKDRKIGYRKTKIEKKDNLLQYGSKAKGQGIRE